MKRTLQQAALILFGEEFVKKATNRVEAVKGIQKIYQKPGDKWPWHFWIPPRNQSDSHGGVIEVAAGDFNPMRRHRIKQPRTQEQLEKLSEQENYFLGGYHVRFVLIDY